MLSVNANGDVVLVNDSGAVGVDIAAQKSTALTAAMSATAQTVVFNTETVDINSAHNTTTGIYTAPVADNYNISASLQFNIPSTAVNSVAVAIRKNGVTIVESANGNANDCCTAGTVFMNIPVSASIALNAGDTITIVTYIKQ